MNLQKSPQLRPQRRQREMSEFTKIFISTLVTIFGVISLTFALIHFIPGDPIDIMLGEQASSVDKASLRKDLGLDKPLFEQYVSYLKGLASLDLGRSIQTKKPVWDEITTRIPASFELAIVTLLFSLIIGIPMGILSALRKNSIGSYILLFIALLGLSMPAFWLGPLLIRFFSIELNLLPISERGTLSHLVLPALTMSSSLIAILMRMTSTSMLNVLKEDFVRVAQAKGLRNSVVYFKHAFLNAIFPILTIVGLLLGSLLTGTVIIETIFDWPGIGQLIFSAIQQRDYPLVQGCVLFVSITYVSVNFLTDCSYRFFNPKVSNS